MTKHEADVIGGLNMTDQISNEAYKQIMIAAQDENEPCWEHDHEILKAYSDGANAVLDKIRDEIREQSRMHMDGDLYIKTSSCMQIINDYMAEEDKA